MLRELHVENFVLARTVQIELHPGLNLITGETGAGKSLLVNALAVVLGERAEAAFVRRGESRAVVQAIFDVSRRPDIVEALAAAGFDAPDGELLVRREISADGRSRAFLSGAPVTVGMLRQLMRGLVELHGQHEPQTLFVPEMHRQLLDRFGDCGALLEAVRRAAREIRDLDGRLAEIAERARQREQRRELLSFRLAEFEAVAPVRGEEDELRRERERLRHAEEIAQALEGALDVLYEGEDAAQDRVHVAARRLRTHAERDPLYEDLADRLDDVRTALQEIATDLRGALEEVTADPGRLDEVEERLLALERLRRRFDGATLDDIIASADEMRRELDGLAEEEDAAEELRARRERAVEAYRQAAAALSARRAEAAARLADEVSRLLAGLAMKDARLEPQLRTRALDELLAAGPPEEGADEVEFLLAANPGEPARPLRKVASGGEISRVMLALDIALGSGLPRRCLVFDEVDQGLGGEAADRLGEFLARAAREHQVVCITHLAQVAARADRHVYVTKKVRSGRTVAVVRPLEDEYDRVEELARMLSGSVVTETARRHAEELLRELGPRGANR
ncbi:MAG: DNA repair protein RecN [Acidobacteriota bacterium]|nr:MAG: DNA repair protein RecN [Acidobacteriota bacterium]